MKNTYSISSLCCALAFGAVFEQPVELILESDITVPAAAPVGVARVNTQRISLTQQTPCPKGLVISS